MPTGKKPRWVRKDILIEPALGAAAATDFTIAVSTITQGEAAARAASQRLAALSVGDTAYRGVSCRGVRPGSPACR